MYKYITSESERYIRLPSGRVIPAINVRKALISVEHLRQMQKQSRHNKR